MPLTSRRDWSAQGVKALSLWFIGYPESVSSFVEGPAGTYTMTARGTDITGPSDEFHFAYKQLSGPGTIIAKVESLRNTNDWAKAGVMIRDTLAPNSAHAMTFITPAQGAVFEFRPAVGENNVSAAEQQTGITAPQWVRIGRDLGGNITASYSSDGISWTELGGNVLNMSTPIYIGLALTSHDTNRTCEATFSNIQITGTVGPQWLHQDIGIPSNDPEPMYVALANSNGTTGVVYHDDPNAARVDAWTEWNIDLQEFAEQGVNLANHNTISIAFGDKNYPRAGGSGKM